LTAHGRYGYSRLHRSLEIAGIALFLGVLLYLSVRIALTVTGSNQLGLVLACLAIGFLGADFISGMVHWVGDTLWDVSTPVIGKHFIRPFREHHIDPKAITHHDFYETNGNNCIASMPVLGAVAPVMPAEPGWSFYICSVVVFTSWFVFWTNQFHKWAHADHPPRIARLLQRWGVILTPTHHDIHHAAPHDKYYCITVGWMNPVLSRLRFFRALEHLVGWAYPSLLHLEERARPVPVLPREPQR
jgi:plasmanylethanolamine desaturase